MGSRLVHPDMLRRLERDFFPQTCTIQQAASDLDEYGQVEAEDDETKWSVVTGLESLACRIAPATGAVDRDGRHARDRAGRPLSGHHDENAGGGGRSAVHDPATEPGCRGDLDTIGSEPGGGVAYEI